MESLYSSNIILWKRDYIIIKSLLLCRLFFESCPLVSRSPKNHVDNSYYRLVVDHFLKLRLWLSIDRSVSRSISSKFFKIALSNQDFYLIPELNELFSIMTMIIVEPTVLLVVALWWCLHRWGVMEVFFFLNLHQNLCMGSRKRSVGVMTAAMIFWL